MIKLKVGMHYEFTFSYPAEEKPVLIKHTGQMLNINKRNDSFSIKSEGAIKHFSFSDLHKVIKT